MLKSIKKSYLVVYNAISAVGWAVILFESIRTCATWSNKQDVLVARALYVNTHAWLKIMLTCAFLDLFHAIVRLVPSNPIIVMPQVLIRWLVIFAIVDRVGNSKESIAFAVVVIAWSVSETLRYAYYALSQVNIDFYPLKWCRYTFFIVIYPLGALAEMICLLMAAFYIQPSAIRRQYSFLLPNPYNISVDLFYILLAWTMIYLPGFPVMYRHMLKQRRSCLASTQEIKYKKSK